MAPDPTIAVGRPLPDPDPMSPAVRRLPSAARVLANGKSSRSRFDAQLPHVLAEDIIKSMSTPLLPLHEGPRVIVYHQTHHESDGGPPISLLPLITNSTGVTHVIIAAIHLNDPSGNITLNDTPPDHEKFNALWSEAAWLQASGIKVLGMLGGFAKGSFERLDGDDLARFESYYVPLRDVIRSHRLDGLDLDIEEPTSLPGTIRLIDRLRVDFGPQFIITLAPVATALLPNQPHLSGPAFDYRLLEQMRGHEIAWYTEGVREVWTVSSADDFFQVQHTVLLRLGRCIIYRLVRCHNKCRLEPKQSGNGPHIQPRKWSRTCGMAETRAGPSSFEAKVPRLWRIWRCDGMGVFQFSAW